MRVLHIIPSYMPAYRYGGPIWSVHSLNKWLVKQGVDVTVYTTNIDGKGTLNVPTNTEALLDGVKVYYFPITIRGWQYAHDLQKALAKNAGLFDVVHITSVFLSASSLGSYYAKKFKKPYIISPRGSLMKEPLGKKSFKKTLYLSLLEKKNLQGASAIHFTTEMEKSEYLEARLPLREGIIIPNGFDPEEFDKAVEPGLFRKKYNIPQDKKIILFLSRISWKKGLDTLIPAFALVKARVPHAVLVLAGGDDEGYKKTVDQLIKKYNLEAAICYTGMITSELKVAAYKESSVFVLPSYSENFGTAILEALYAEVPVIITDVLPLASDIQNVNAGLVVKKDEHALADAILKCMRDEEMRRTMGVNGKRFVLNNFNWQNIGERFIKEYTKLIETTL